MSTEKNPSAVNQEEPQAPEAASGPESILLMPDVDPMEGIPSVEGQRAALAQEIRVVAVETPMCRLGRVAKRE